MYSKKEIPAVTTRIGAESNTTAVTFSTMKTYIIVTRVDQTYSPDVPA